MTESKRDARFVAALVPESQVLLDDKLYYGPMLQGLSDALMEKGTFLRPVQCLQEYQKEHFLHTPSSFYKGVVFLGLLYTSKLFIRAVVETLKCPKVVLDHHFEDIPMHSVREDAVAGMRAVTEHLLSLGHRRIAYLDMSRPEAKQSLSFFAETGLTSLTMVVAAIALFFPFQPYISIPLLALLAAIEVMDILAYMQPRRLEVRALRTLPTDSDQ